VSEKPSGREDPPPPAGEVALTADQFELLVRSVPKRHGGVRLRDLGAAHVEIEVLDAEGNVMKSRQLGPRPAGGVAPPTPRRFRKEGGQ
jgi:hypothetical protein